MSGSLQCVSIFFLLPVTHGEETITNTTQNVPISGHKELFEAIPILNIDTYTKHFSQIDTKLIEGGLDLKLHLNYEPDAINEGRYTYHRL